jgi:hypothetical protein
VDKNICSKSEKKIKIHDKNAIFEIFKKNFSLIISNNRLDLFTNCMICSSTEHLKYYYIKSIKDLREKIKLNKYNYFNYKYILDHPQTFFNIMHVILNKKQIIICIKCQNSIYRGTQKISIILKNIKKLKKEINL